MGDSSDCHLSRSFFMGKKHENDDRMIFYKKFAHPVNVDKWKCLNFFSIRGFRYWQNNSFALINDDKYNKLDHILVIKAGDELTNILIPPFITYLSGFEELVNFISNLINKTLKSDDQVVFQGFGGGVVHFKVLKEKVEVKFSNVLCDMFDFQKDHVYSKTSKKQFFLAKNSFKNGKCDHVGISLNFGFNQIRAENEIIAILCCEDVPFCSFFHKNLIEKAQKMDFKFVAIQELEIRFIDLSSGQILRSVFGSTDVSEIYVDMSFSQI